MNKQLIDTVNKGAINRDRAKLPLSINDNNRVLLSIIALQLVFLYAPTVVWLWQRWTISVWHHAHGLLIVPIVGYLIWKKLKEERSLPASSHVMGFIILIPALLLHMLDAGIHSQLLSAAAFFLALPGLSLVFLGVQRTKGILFPLAFLLLTLPIPLAFTGRLHLELREIATASTAFIVPYLGIPLVTEGTSIYIPNGTLQIADACSGFSTLYASVVVACLAAYMCPVRTRRILVLIIAAPVAIAANILRVVLLVVLVHWQGMEILGTSWHTTSGMLTFIIALPVILYAGHVPVPKEISK